MFLSFITSLTLSKKYSLSEKSIFPIFVFSGKVALLATLSALILAKALDSFSSPR